MEGWIVSPYFAQGLTWQAAPVVREMKGACQTFSGVSGFFATCSGSCVGCERMNQTGGAFASTVVAAVDDHGYNKSAYNFLALPACNPMRSIAGR
jgi:hypothetical protein